MSRDEWDETTGEMTLPESLQRHPQRHHETPSRPYREPRQAPPSGDQDLTEHEARMLLNLVRAVQPHSDAWINVVAKLTRISHGF